MAKLYIGDSQGTPAIVKIEEVPKTKFGISVDAFLGDVDENGVYQIPTEPFTLDLSSIKSLPYYYGLYYKFCRTSVSGTLTIGLEGDLSSRGAMYSCFYNCTGLTSINLSSLTTVSGSSSMYSCFQNCDGLTSIDFSSLTTVSGSNALQYCFDGCTGLTSVNLSSLTTVSGNYALQSCFDGCTGLTSVNLSSLTTVSGSGALQSCFDHCTKLSTISFPVLTSVVNNSFGSASYNYIFNGCKALTEIHFRADMQATIEAMTGYANKWGATNATIYFDL